MKILDNYITELYDWPNWPQNLEVEHEEEADADEKGTLHFAMWSGKSYEGHKG